MAKPELVHTAMWCPTTWPSEVLRTPSNRSHTLCYKFLPAAVNLPVISRMCNTKCYPIARPLGCYQGNALTSATSPYLLQSIMRATFPRQCYSWESLGGKPKGMHWNLNREEVGSPAGSIMDLAIYSTIKHTSQAINHPPGSTAHTNSAITSQHPSSPPPHRNHLYSWASQSDESTCNAANDVKEGRASPSYCQERIKPSPLLHVRQVLPSGVTSHLLPCHHDTCLTIIITTPTPPPSAAALYPSTTINLRCRLPRPMLPVVPCRPPAAVLPP